MVRLRTIRDALPLPDDAVLARFVRSGQEDGRLYDRDILIADAETNFIAFGWYGLSLWATTAALPLGALLAAKGKRFHQAALYTAASLRDRGLGLVPSGRAPRYDANVDDVAGRRYGSAQAVASTVDDLIDRFIAASYTVVDNPHYRDDLDRDDLDREEHRCCRSTSTPTSIWSTTRTGTSHACR